MKNCMVISILHLTNFMFENGQFSVFKCALFFQAQMKLFIIYSVCIKYSVYIHIYLYTHGVCIYINYLYRVLMFP